MKPEIQRKTKPDFVRQKYGKWPKLGRKWRRAKGKDSKMRVYFKGHRLMPTVGYGAPKKLKYLNRQGLQEKLVSSLKDLENVQKNEIIVISATLGERKKIVLLNKIKELKLKVVNVKDIDGYVKLVQERLAKKKTKSKEKEELKKKSKEEALKKKEEEKKKEEAKEVKPKEEAKKPETTNQEKSKGKK